MTKKQSQKQSFQPLPLIPAGILETVSSQYENLSPGLRDVADYILQNPSTFCFLPVKELAAKAGVSHSTVIRFCKTLGYKGFYDFSRDVQQVMQAGLSSMNRYDMSRKPSENARESDGLLREVLDQEMNSLASIADRISTADIEDCAKRIVAADNTFILGLMASSVLALHLEQMLSKVVDNVHLVPPWSLQAVSMLQRISDRSVLVAFSFPRYPAGTYDFTVQARNRGCGVIALTNSNLSPMAKLADKALYVPVGLLSYVDLYAAPMAVSSALALACSRVNPTHTSKRLTGFDKAVTNQHLFLR